MKNKMIWINTGAFIFLFTGIVYGLGRLLKNAGLFWLLGRVTGGSSILQSIGGFFRFFIFIAAIAYVFIAILGFLTKKFDNLDRIIGVIGVIFLIVGLVGFVRVGGLLNLLKIAGGAAYAVGGLLIRTEN